MSHGLIKIINEKETRILKSKGTDVGRSLSLIIGYHT